MALAAGSHTKRAFSVQGRTPVVGYIRVSTEEQVESGLGLEAQRRAIMSAAETRGWQLLRICEDAGASGKSLTGRPGLVSALDAVESGEAASLVVAKLDRLSRSLMDFAGLMDRSRRRGWGLVALDLGVDSGTPSGEMLASVLAVFAQFERRMIGVRTREALAVKRAQGVRLGRPPILPSATVARMTAFRRRGMTLQAIAARLNDDGVPTAHGGRRWHSSTVHAVLRAAE